MRGRSQNSLHTAALRTQACPVCGSAAGVPCRKTRGGIAWPPHKARVDAARAFRETHPAKEPTDD